MRHHSAGRLLGTARVIVRIAQDRVIAELPGPRKKAFDELREKWVLDVGNNDAKHARIARRQTTGMEIWQITKSSYRRKHQASRAPAHFSPLIQDVGHRSGGNSCCFRNISNCQLHKSGEPSSTNG